MRRLYYCYSRIVAYRRAGEERLCHYFIEELKIMTEYSRIVEDLNCHCAPASAASLFTLLSLTDVRCCARGWTHIRTLAESQLKIISSSSDEWGSVFIHLPSPLHNKPFRALRSFVFSVSFSVAILILSLATLQLCCTGYATAPPSEIPELEEGAAVAGRFDLNSKTPGDWWQMCSVCVLWPLEGKSKGYIVGGAPQH